MNIDLSSLTKDKSVKPKVITESICQLILENKLSLSELLKFASTEKDSIKASCIESIEFVTKKDASQATEECLQFVSEALTSKAPRIKWESARVIGNIASRFPDKLDMSIRNLLDNTEHPGTVVRWSAAYALGEILKINNKKTRELIPAIEAIIAREEKNSIINIYTAALRKLI